MARERFETIEEAREYFSFISDDAEEIKMFMDKGDYLMAWRMMNKIVEDWDIAKTRYPELEKEITIMAAQIIPMAFKLAKMKK